MREDGLLAPKTSPFAILETPKTKPKKPQPWTKYGKLVSRPPKKPR